MIDKAHTKTTGELGCRTNQLIIAARQGTLMPAKLRRSTSTVSNFGASGVDPGVLVINHPEAAILATEAIKQSPLIVGDEVVARPTMTLICSTIGSAVLPNSSTLANCVI
ncbi:2-oxoacid dehydrogenases acyltransferase family protein [Mycobacterium kansasii 732]|uniref:2-oxo acid dehydrogenase subunit E2 n=1 Tax=Mycobacterium pseudokansasii TaxID=2341080 RepID=UPI00044B1187|nr:2-oxo acid dehydrogenase subunit E2 [Mycobacterium pseudokansasii]EUA13044.1 2-oxoacid dehydrogenases acyltransferase family protein [Mycobacterium kansasii 732]